MRIGLVLIALYVVGTALLTYLAIQRVAQIEAMTGETFREVALEIVLEGTKAVANTVVLYHGVILYCAQPTDAPRSMV